MSSTALRHRQDLLERRCSIEIFAFLIGLTIFALDIWAILAVLSSGAPAVEKLLWVLLIVLLPVAGLILWWLLGPRGRTARI